ncbi:hypothetical protein SCUP515_02170 [Seiridium cupressi]
MNKLTRQELDDKPWKYIGYKDFARYSSLSDDFFVVRRYDRIHCRVLLAKQDRIAKLEEELDTLDDSSSSRTASDMDNGTLKNDKSQGRKQILADLGRELRSYDELLVHFLDLKTRQNAPKRIVRNIRTWLANNNQPIAMNEIEFLRADDLITVAATQKSYVRLSFERWVLGPIFWLYGLFKKNNIDTATVYGKDEPIDVLASISVFFAALIMLVGPLWALFFVENMLKRLGVITSFVAILLLFLTSATLARPFEILAVTAGYSAVLVVFLQIGTGPDTHHGP